MRVPPVTPKRSPLITVAPPTPTNGELKPKLAGAAITASAKAVIVPPAIDHALSVISPAEATTVSRLTVSRFWFPTTASGPGAYGSADHAVTPSPYLMRSVSVSIPGSASSSMGSSLVHVAAAWWRSCIFHRCIGRVMGGYPIMIAS